MTRDGKSRTRTRGLLPFGAALLVVLGLTGAALGWKRQERAVLRGELEMARREADEGKRVREVNRDLRQQQPTAADLERLRSDHAALVQLRAEMETFRK